MISNIKIIFFGTPQFAVPALKALHQEGYNIVLVVTQVDQPIGRKQILTPMPVKVEAKELGLEICQRFEDLKLKTKNLKLDLGIVAAYGKIIPKKILDLFPYGILNIHPSLLPKYRGPSPIQSAILNGDVETGVTIIKLDEKMDHGEIIFNFQFSIFNNDTYESLSEKLAVLGAKMLVAILPDYLAGKIKLEPQDDDKATYTKIINKEDGRINWQKSAVEIERQIRAYYPWPGSYAKFSIFNFQFSIKIISAKTVNNLNSEDSTEIGKLQKKNGQLYIRCGTGSLLIEKLQPEGKKVMTAKEFINGYLK